VSFNNVAFKIKAISATSPKRLESNVFLDVVLSQPSSGWLEARELFDMNFQIEKAQARETVCAFDLYI
jgi:hypothetical protein